MVLEFLGWTVKKEKELPKLKEKADKSKLASARRPKEETKEEEENELLVEEATNVDDPPLVQAQPQIDV